VDRRTKDRWIGAGFPLSQQGDITRLLKELNSGKEGAEDELLHLLYNELRTMARHFMRGERAGHTLQTTALVHEAYIRLCGSTSPLENKAHFIRLAARAMRHVLIDHARRRNYQKRGGKESHQRLTDIIDAFQEANTVDLIALDQALSRLSALDPRGVQVVELRFFAGLTVEQTAEVLDISPRTVKGDWHMTRAWLKKELNG